MCDRGHQYQYRIDSSQHWHGFDRERVTRSLSLGSDVKSAPGTFCAVDHGDSEGENEDSEMEVRVRARADQNTCKVELKTHRTGQRDEYREYEYV